MELLQAVIGV